MKIRNALRFTAVIFGVVIGFGCAKKSREDLLAELKLVKPGMTKAQVREICGEPYTDTLWPTFEQWTYVTDVTDVTDMEPGPALEIGAAVRFRDGKVFEVSPIQGHVHQ